MANQSLVENYKKTCDRLANALKMCSIKSRVIPLSAQEAYGFRYLNRTHDVNGLEEKYIDVLGLSVIGSIKWNNLNNYDKLNVVKNNINDDLIKSGIDLSKFDTFKFFINSYLQKENLFDLFFNNYVNKFDTILNRNKPMIQISEIIPTINKFNNKYILLSNMTCKIGCSIDYVNEKITKYLNELFTLIRDTFVRFDNQSKLRLFNANEVNQKMITLNIFKSAVNEFENNFPFIEICSGLWKHICLLEQWFIESFIKDSTVFDIAKSYVDIVCLFKNNMLYEDAKFDSKIIMHKDGWSHFSESCIKRFYHFFSSNFGWTIDDKFECLNKILIEKFNSQKLDESYVFWAKKIIFNYIKFDDVSQTDELLYTIFNLEFLLSKCDVEKDNNLGKCKVILLEELCKLYRDS